MTPESATEGEHGLPQDAADKAAREQRGPYDWLLIFPVMRFDSAACADLADELRTLNAHHVQGTAFRVRSLRYHGVAPFDDLRRHSPFVAILLGKDRVEGDLAEEQPPRFVGEVEPLLLASDQAAWRARAERFRQVLAGLRL